MSDGGNVLMAMYPGGGNIAQLRPIMACLVAQGHRVRVLVGPGVNRARLPADASLLRSLRSTGAEVMRLREPKVHSWDAVRSDQCVLFGRTPKAFRHAAQDLASRLSGETPVQAAVDERASSIGRTQTVRSE